MEKLADLLIEYSDKLESIKPSISWGNYEELKNRMIEVASKIHLNQYDIKNFYFSDFNGKSPQGELWEYIDSNYPELKIIGLKIRKKHSELNQE